MRNHGNLALTLVCATWVALIWFWPNGYLTLSVDDSFYYLRIADNVAKGLGPTFDRVEPTNGFQPLWMALLAALALLPLDTPDAMRLALSVNVVLLRVAGALLARSRPRIELILALLLSSFWLTKVFVNGMESSLVAALIAACLLAPDSARARWGVLGGLLVLARLDAVFFVLPWLLRRPRAAIGAAAVVAPWAIASFVVFGHVMPVSAAVKYDGVPIEAWLMLLVALGGGWVARGLREWPLLAYALAMIVVGGWFEIWRLVPLALGLALGLATLSPRRLAIVALGWALLGAVTWIHRLNPVSYAPYLAGKRSGIWLRERTPQGAIVAGWDCGIAAAHSDRRFFQLEGLVGSWRFFEKLRDGKTAEWIDEQRVDYIAQSIARDATSLEIDGVELGTWRVARSECVEFRSIVAPATPVTRLYFVVRRTGLGPTLAELMASEDACAPRD